MTLFTAFMLSTGENWWQLQSIFTQKKRLLQLQNSMNKDKLVQLVKFAKELNIEIHHTCSPLHVLDENYSRDTSTS